MKNCKYCGKQIDNRVKSGLCKKCYEEYNWNKRIANWKKTGDTGSSINSTGLHPIRKYLYIKQNNRCAICNMLNIWNGKEIKFILDHIDGNAANNWEDNLRLICLNCDSQLDTYKSKNKNSARKYRKNY